MIFEDLKIAAFFVVMTSSVFFTIPIAITAGVKVAQKIGVVECVTPQAQSQTENQ